LTTIKSEVVDVQGVGGHAPAAAGPAATAAAAAAGDVYATSLRRLSSAVVTAQSIKLSRHIRSRLHQPGIITQITAPHITNK